MVFSVTHVRGFQPLEIRVATETNHFICSGLTKLSFFPGSIFLRQMCGNHVGSTSVSVQMKPPRGIFTKSCFSERSVQKPCWYAAKACPVSRKHWLPWMQATPKRDKPRNGNGCGLDLKPFHSRHVTPRRRYITDAFPCDLSVFSCFRTNSVLPRVRYLRDSPSDASPRSGDSLVIYEKRESVLLTYLCRSIPRPCKKLNVRLPCCC